MGVAQPTLFETLNDYCAIEAEASRKCMESYQFNRDEYRPRCREFFIQFRACKARYLNRNNGDAPSLDGAKETNPTTSSVK